MADLSTCYPIQVLSALQHFDAAQAALQNDDFKTAIRHFQQASDAEPEVHIRSLSNCLYILIMPDAHQQRPYQAYQPQSALHPAECGISGCSGSSAC